MMPRAASWRGIGRLATLAAVALSAAAPQPPALFDLLVRGGVVVDGTGAPRRRADVAITGGTIMAVGSLRSARARDTIDARGLFVAPGFINVHSHAEPEGLRSAVNMLTQGVTTEILNADGGGELDVRAQLRAQDSLGMAVNVAANIGFNAVWESVMGETDRRPSSEEMAAMRRRIEDNLDAGAVGVSAGLDYKPGYYATEEEVGQIVSVAKPWRVAFPNHDRLTPELKFSARAGVRETMRIGVNAGLIPVVTHMKVTGVERGTARVILGQMGDWSARGDYVAADVYPYLSGMTALGALTIPGWAQNGGIVEFRKRLADSSLRARIVRETDETMRLRFTGADGVIVLSTNRTLADYMREFGTASPGEAIARILEQDSPGAILGFGEERDLIEILKYPHAAISCDCGATVGATGHPRNFGTFPRVLGRYVREQRVLTWENAVRKMTALPAALAGFLDRGIVAPGMAADLTTFDPNTIADRATFAQPGLRSTGVRDVIVNGKVALRAGEVTGTRAGRSLRKTLWSPSRPMSGYAQPQRFAVRGVMALEDQSRVAVTVDARRPAGSSSIVGRAVIETPDGRWSTSDGSLGSLQHTRGWQSIVGLVRNARTGLVAPFTVVVDSADPRGAAQITTILIGDAPPLRGVLGR